MRVFTLFAISTMSLAIAGPAVAQDSMMKDGMHSGAMAQISAADTRRMHSCNAMSHERMMRSPTCRRMAQMHPEMMHLDNKMEHEGAMAHDDMMTSGQ